MSEGTYHNRLKILLHEGCRLRTVEFSNKALIDDFIWRNPDLHEGFSWIEEFVPVPHIDPFLELPTSEPMRRHRIKPEQD